MAIRESIGKDLYLFRGVEGRSDYLIITSHGSAIPGRNFRTPPGTTLNFYAPQNQRLRMGLQQFRLGVTVAQRVPPGTLCTDHILTKYQGRHGSAQETYQSIGAYIDRVRREINHGAPMPSLNEFLAPFEGQEDDEALAAAMEVYRDHMEARGNLLPMDVLTIRARGLRSYGYGGVYLSTVLRTLTQRNYRYSEVFCSFCRSTSTTTQSHAPADY